ncbi:Endonuclease/exonuclease/phosphatase [Collybia nuda]|uniref:DNA-(apurinic or apyrimidinic site) endonuclease 2 n=1 Tax=Collybia nuda TaxID=64659 RepID=A0A9P5Y7U1_9AGAR|nr:Endonuclease/exonuclease/phosphatase [Collybia nuda]
MRILTWNIASSNGIRTLPQYHPWNTFKTHDGILNHLQADIICFQEMKSSRSNLPKPVAIPPSYNAFFSFPMRKSGYSGVATYTHTSVVPCKAEEGLSGIVQPKPPLTAEERVSKVEAYPQRVISDQDEGKDEEEVAQLNYKDLDSEGRTVVVDLGLFVLINVYCPNDGNGTEERDKYKSDFHRVLEARVKGLIEREGREVVVVGDLNACAAVIDHCEGQLMVARGHAEGMEGEDGFWGKDVRRWLRDWMINDDGSGGCMIDIVRKLWPDRKAMYTCWNTKISARDSNYGTRIDFILITKGILPWVKGADIQPEIKGSDHCPVYLDLHDEITDDKGQSIKLRDVLGVINSEVPRLASKFWDEYSGKQTSLQSFFGRKHSEQKAPSTTPSGEPIKSTEQAPIILSPFPSSEVPTSSPLVAAALPHPIPASSNFTLEVNPSPIPLAMSPQPVLVQSQPSSTLKPTPTLEIINLEGSTSKPPKRKLTTDALSHNTAIKKQKQQKPPEKTPSQTKLSTFFAKPKPTPPSPPPILTSRQRSKLKAAECEDPLKVDLEADHELAILLSQESNSSQQSMIDVVESKQAWSSLLAPIQAPKCLVHGETAKEMTVGKPGPNKGKKFFICARPVGPGYDKGRAERLREHVDPTWRCNFFKWSSDARREMRKGNS